MALLAVAILQRHTSRGQATLCSLERSLASVAWLGIRAVT